MCCQKLKIFLCAAISATIKYPTEPSKVKFPAKVDDEASINQAGVGFVNPAIIGFYSKTAGTVETRLLNTILKNGIFVRFN